MNHFVILNYGPIISVGIEKFLHAIKVVLTSRIVLRAFHSVRLPKF